MADPKARDGAGNNAIVGRQEESLAQQLAAQAQQKRLRARRRSTRTQTCNQSIPAWTQAGIASPAQRAGIQVEDRVCQYLQTQGLQILARNVQTRHGEIDIVCVDAKVLVFVEVRQRTNLGYGGAAASVGARKQQRLIRSAQACLEKIAIQHFAGKMPACRFDVVALECDTIVWLKQAFHLDVC